MDFSWRLSHRSFKSLIVRETLQNCWQVSISSHRCRCKAHGQTPDFSLSPTKSLWLRFVKIQLQVRVQIALRQPNKNTGEWLFLFHRNRITKCKNHNNVICMLWRNNEDSITQCIKKWALWYSLFVVEIAVAIQTVNILFSVFLLATMPTAKIIHGRKLMNEIRARSNGGIMTGESRSARRNTCPNTLCTTNSTWTHFLSP
jgi:hypothetical protein